MFRAARRRLVIKIAHHWLCRLPGLPHSRPSLPPTPHHFAYSLDVTWHHPVMLTDWFSLVLPAPCGATFWEIPPLGAGGKSRAFRPVFSRNVTGSHLGSVAPIPIYPCLQSLWQKCVTHMGCCPWVLGHVCMATVVGVVVALFPLDVIQWCSAISDAETGGHHLLLWMWPVGLGTRRCTWERAM